MRSDTRRALSQLETILVGLERLGLLSPDASLEDFERAMARLEAEAQAGADAAPVSEAA